MRPPNDLDNAGKKAWSSVVKDLKALGTLHDTDAKLIELYSRTYSLFRRVEDQLSTEALTTGGERKFINPLASLYPTLAGKLEKTLHELGLTSRTRKPDEDQPEHDPNFGDFEDQ